MRRITIPLTAAFMIMLMFIAFSCKKDNQVKTPVATKPVVTNVQPKNPAPGDVVTITGTGFGATAADVKVTIGAQVITITSVTDTKITFTLPAGITAGDIAVAIKAILANNTDPQKATITPKPAPLLVATITGINPTSAKVGDTVIITGTNFSTTIADDAVKFNTIAATVLTASATQLKVIVPATATTGTVTLSVKAATVITGPSFTIKPATTGGGGSTVSYITVLEGKATFSKIATAQSEIGAMIVDRKKNTLYYADYTIFKSAHPGTLYKLKLDGSAAVAVTTDARIKTIMNIATDASGNIYVEAGLDNLGLKANIYKIDYITAAVTAIASNVNFGGAGGTMLVDSRGTIWLNYAQRLNLTSNKLENIPTPNYGSLRAALFNGDNIYVDDVNHLANGNIGFYKYNLLTTSYTGTVTDFTLQGMFNQDNADMGSSTASDDSFSRYALDDSENFYAIYPYYVAGHFYHRYAIRKTKNGSGGASTLITKFTTKFTIPQFVEPRDHSEVLFQSDATGNLYLKYNNTDIIKITQ